MNAPDIPGRIIAQIAIAPARNNIGNEWVVFMAVNPVNQSEKINPNIIYGKFFSCCLFDCLYTNNADIKINPRKNAYVMEVYAVNKYPIIWETVNSAIAIPRIKGIKNGKSIFFMLVLAFFMLLFAISFKINVLILFIP